jgi:hypothetical protein
MAAAEASRNDAGSRYFSVGRKVPDFACLPSQTSSGGDMGVRKRRWVEPRDDQERLELPCAWDVDTTFWRQAERGIPMFFGLFVV